MKELSIEGKATRYDQAIKVAKSKIKNDKDHVLYEDDVIEIFPELKESEDERMIQYFKDLAPFDKADELYEKYGFSHKDAISWLEKQGGHAKFINGIQVGDKVTRNEDGVLVNLSQLNRVAKKQGEQKPATWSKEDEKIKESIITGLEMLKDGVSDQSLIALYNKKNDWLKSLKDKYTWKPSEEQMLAINTAINVIGKGTINGKYLVELHEQLKKLREGKL